LPALPRTDSGPDVELSLPEETPPVTVPEVPGVPLPRVEVPAVPLPRVEVPAVPLPDTGPVDDALPNVLP
jgi:hypothetical protein